jgi:hypothetical protein
LNGYTGVQGPGGIGSYLARREFGSNEEQQTQGKGAATAAHDSGYISHGSGTGAFPKMKLPVREELSISGIRLASL